MPTYNLYSWGANSHGQLGQSVKSEECLVPREVDLTNSSLNAEDIQKIVGGAGHSLILDKRGQVYSCGWNNKGQTGHPGTENVLKFRKVNGNIKDQVVVDIACGWDNSAALTKENTVFVWGGNSYGQLGIDPSALRYSCDPFRITIDKSIKRVAMGLRHTVLVTCENKLLAAGASNKGQLGVVVTDINRGRDWSHEFTEVTDLTNIKDASCGQRHTIAIAENGELYAFGDNKHGQLGFNPTYVMQTSLCNKVYDAQMKPSAKVCAGWSHNVVLNDEEIFAWGRNTYGQLGCRTALRPHPWIPERVQGLSKIKQLAVGSEHNLVVTEEGALLSWGWNEHGNCGIGVVRDIFAPERSLISSDLRTILIGSGAAHSFAVTRKDD